MVLTLEDERFWRGEEVKHELVVVDNMDLLNVFIEVESGLFTAQMYSREREVLPAPSGYGKKMKKKNMRLL